MTTTHTKGRFTSEKQILRRIDKLKQHIMELEQQFVLLSRDRMCAMSEGDGFQPIGAVHDIDDAIRRNDLNLRRAKSKLKKLGEKLSIIRTPTLFKGEDASIPRK